MTKQGQLTVPREARSSLTIDDESELFWYECNGFLVLSKDLENPKELAKKLKKR